jgi:hypothetical protein
VARHQREDQVQAIDKYATSLFYGAGPERPNQRSTNSFGATYANGQARPVTPMMPMNRPVPKVEPVSSGTNATNLRNDNWRQDQIVLSRETQDLRSGSAWSAGNVAFSKPAPSTGREDAAGPRYSDEFRRTLDALLRGA